jgi:hypothetical protein
MPIHNLLFLNRLFIVGTFITQHLLRIMKNGKKGLKSLQPALFGLRFDTLSSGYLWRFLNH